RAVVGGVSAISLVLRDPSITCDVLQVYAGCFTYQSLVNNLEQCPQTAAMITFRDTCDAPERFVLDRDITSITTFYLRTGKFLVVYKSSVVSACSTISRSPTTAHMTFFTEHTFACAYPALTFSRRAIMADLRMDSRCETDPVVMEALTRAGFEFTVNPAHWPEYKMPEGSVNPSNTYACLRERFLCPVQGRYFGDRGSFVGFLDPLARDPRSIRAANVPPFGSMVAWRLFTSYDCAESCDILDPILHEWLVSTPILIL
ncbi:hypothetical protein C8Q76DRAFT_569002, partial [Earliella scabrosa]